MKEETKFLVLSKVNALKMGRRQTDSGKEFGVLWGGRDSLVNIRLSLK